MVDTIGVAGSPEDASVHTEVSTPQALGKVAASEHIPTREVPTTPAQFYWASDQSGNWKRHTWDSENEIYRSEDLRHLSGSSKEIVPFLRTEVVGFLSNKIAWWSNHEQLLRSNTKVIISELLTNALIHAGEVSQVSVRLDDDGFLLEVGDPLIGASPITKLAQEHHEGGRGMSLVDEYSGGRYVVRYDHSTSPPLKHVGVYIRNPAV